MDMKKYRVPKTAITERGLKKLLKQAAKEYASLSEWANDNKITPQAVSAFMRNTQGAGLQIPAALGYRPQIIFMPVEEEPIAHMNPPRRPTSKPSAKVDHSREPVEKRHLRGRNDRSDTKARLKARSR